ncbi:hypothetical protein SNEBB_007003 [Seison nebaliae]|nr:hypothetical protein SNEBB_007003 [Seison nebaliae]
MEELGEEFTNLLKVMINPSGTDYDKAEEAYTSMEVPKKLALLWHLATTSEEMDLRTFALVLLRKVVQTNLTEWWTEFDKNSQNEFKNKLLDRIIMEENIGLRRRYIDVSVELLRGLNELHDNTNENDEDVKKTNGNGDHVIIGHPWEEYVNFVHQYGMNTNSNSLTKQTVLYVLSSHIGLYGNSFDSYQMKIVELINHLMMDNDIFVRLACLKAMNALFSYMEDGSKIPLQFHPCLAQVLNTLQEDIRTQTTREKGQQLDIEGDNCALKSMIDLAECGVRLFKPLLPDFCRTLLETVRSNEKIIEEETKHLALEVLITMCETSPNMVKQNAGPIFGDIVESCLKMMVNVDDDESWVACDEDEDEDQDSDPIIGESCLDRLSCALQGKMIVEPLFKMIERMLESESWKERYAALMAISASGEGSLKEMEKMLESIVFAVCSFGNDAHPRVRYAVCNALGQMSTDFAPKFQKQYGEQVIQTLLTILENETVPRTQAHAGAAIVNFSEDAMLPNLKPHLKPILQSLSNVLGKKIDELLTTKRKHVLEQVITSIAAVSDTAQKEFTDYYSWFIDNLKKVYKIADAQKLDVLSGKTIECISLIGLAVGSDIFMKDCSEVMNYLMQCQEHFANLPADNQQISYMISAWARMCTILGKKFEPYLPTVMPSVMKVASLKPEIHQLSSDDIDEVDEDELQIITIKNQQTFAIRTTGLEEKNNACSMLICYMKDLGDAFAPYISDVAELMIPLLRFYFHDNVRANAVEAMPYLLKCGKAKGQTFFKTLWNNVHTELISALNYEPEREYIGDMFTKLGECLELVGYEFIDEDQISEIFKVMSTKLQEREKDQEEKLKKKKDDIDDDSDEIEFPETEEQPVLSNMSDCFHIIMKMYGANILPHFDKFVQKEFKQLILNESSSTDRQWGICAWDDVFEFGGTEALEAYGNNVIPLLIAQIKDTEPGVRQAASYGIGILASKYWDHTQQICKMAIDVLVQEINKPNSRVNDNNSATENCISAATKIIRNLPQDDTLKQILPTWFSWLPTWEDREESEHIFGYLCDLTESRNEQIVGENLGNLPTVFKVILQCFNHDGIDRASETGKRMIAIVTAISQMENILPYIEVLDNSLYETMQSLVKEK